MIWDRKWRMLFIRTYVAPAKASEEVALMKAKAVNTKPKTLMRLSENSNSFSLKQIFHNSFNKWYRRRKKKKGKKPHGSHSHNVQHVDAGWLSSLKYSWFFFIGKSPQMTKKYPARPTLKWVRYLSVPKHWQTGLQSFHLHMTGWLPSQGLVMAFSLGFIQKK